jgi:hypothetical protein
MLPRPPVISRSTLEPIERIAERAADWRAGRIGSLTVSFAPGAPR